MKAKRIENLMGVNVVVTSGRITKVFEPSRIYEQVEIDYNLIERSEMKINNFPIMIVDELYKIENVPMREKGVYYIVPDVIRETYKQRKDFISPSGTVSYTEDTCYCSAMVKNY